MPPRYPGIPTPSTESAALLRVLNAMKEGLEVGQRLRGDPLDSFVRLRDLVDAGLIQVSGNSLLGLASGGSTFVIPKGATFVMPEGAGPLTLPITKVPVTIPFAGRIVGVELLTEGGVGNCVVDIWKDSYANFPPTLGDSITAAAKPTIIGSTKYHDTVLAGWDNQVSAGDTLRFVLESVTVFTYIACAVLIEPS